MTKTEIDNLLKEAELNPLSFFRPSDPVRNITEIRWQVHPDRWPNDKDWAESTFKRFGQLYDLARSPMKLESAEHVYELFKESISRGELRNVYLAKVKNSPRIIKVPVITNSVANNLAAKEMEVCRQLHEPPTNCNWDYEAYTQYYPKPIESFISASDKRRVNVFDWPGKVYSAVEIKDRYPKGLDGRHVAWMFRRLMVALGYAHRRGWCHGAVVPEHTMYRVSDHGLVLTGWIHAENPTKPIKYVPKNRKSWYPRDIQKTKILTPGTDIYMASTLALWLADHRELPGSLKQFFNGCRLLGVNQPQDAWEIHDEFSTVLKREYGDPKFVDLEM